MPQWFPPRKMRRPAFMVGIMSKKPKIPKARAAGGTDRRATALRENLRRRKRQQRLRDEAGPKIPTKTDD
jgi:hypothetical protein